jgi:CheY-like chemotaxis protein/anti-sigma regulatory factor (Ser/Thr protein kinase)
MNGVLGMAQALSSTALEPGQRRMVDVIRDSGTTLLTILNDILDMSKIEAGRMELESIPFEPAALARAVRDLFDQRASEKGVLLRSEIGPGGEQWRMGDPARLRQIVFNLVSNALKFTEDGTVTVRITGTPTHLVIAVADTGIGIAPDRLGRLFAKFTQADSSHTRLYGGTGLGLSISKAIAEQMGGDILVDSTEGEGSTFTVTVPLGITEAVAASALAVPPPPSLPATGTAEAPTDAPSLRVLAAEDNPTNRFVLQTLLDPLGISVTFAEDGRKALDIWRVEAFDVIVMDMQMPVMDGVTATRAIRAEEARTGRQRTPIVALTANAMAHQIAEQLEAGADAHAAKPIALPALLAAMETAMAIAAGVPEAEAKAATRAPGGV